MPIFNNKTRQIGNAALELWHDNGKCICIDVISVQSLLQFVLKVDSFPARRNLSDISFLYKLFNGIIFCSPLLQSISFDVPQYTILVIVQHPTLKLTAQTMDKIINSIGNTSNFDIFFNNLSDLKRHYLNHLIYLMPACLFCYNYSL